MRVGALRGCVPDEQALWDALARAAVLALEDLDEHEDHEEDGRLADEAQAVLREAEARLGAAGSAPGELFARWEAARAGGADRSGGDGERPDGDAPGRRRGRGIAALGPTSHTRMLSFCAPDPECSEAERTTALDAWRALLARIDAPR